MLDAHEEGHARGGGPGAAAPADSREQGAAPKLLLDRMWLLEGLPAAELAELEAACQERRFTGGETIFRQGDPSDGIYLIAAGAVHEIARVRSGGGPRPRTHLHNARFVLATGRPIALP